MAKQRLISVIVPVYNVEEYLDRCIESIVGQTYSCIEILLIDDGSEDNSGKLCDKWAQKDNRIRVFHKRNGGLSTARNLGLKQSKGEFITFVDSDDYVDLNMYGTMIKAMDDKDVDIVSCGTVIEFPERMKQRKKTLFMPTDKKKQFVQYKKNEGISELLLARSFSFSVCDKLFRKYLFDKIYFPVGRSSEDLPVVFHIFQSCISFVNIGQVKYHYVYRENSICRQDFFFRRVDSVIFAGAICKEIVQCYPQFRKQAEVFYMRSLASIIHKIQICENRKDFLYLEKRLRGILTQLFIRNIFNPYIINNKSFLQVLWHCWVR